MTASISATLDADRAKELAALLRADLAGAGYAIPHSLALDLIAHQHGARDWNTLHARLSRPEAAVAPQAAGPRATTDPLEWETVQQTTTAMTVAELRASVDALPAAMHVMVSRPSEPGPDSSRYVIPATAAEVGPGFGGSDDVVTLRGDLMTGAHRRARRVTLTLTGVPRNIEGRGDPTGVVERLRSAVEAGTRATGHRRLEYRYRPDEGVMTWTWVSGGVPLEHVVARARAEIDALNPGAWDVTIGPSVVRGT